MTSFRFPAFNRSTALGRPSFTLKTVFEGSPAARKAAAVPRVANSWNPNSWNFAATFTPAGLSRSFTLMKRAPPSGIGVPAANCALPNASPKLSPTPITSPVDFISGPNAGSTPGNFANGNTGLFT